MRLPLTWDAIRSGEVPVATESSYHGNTGQPREAGPSRELLTFDLAGEEYAIDILRIGEIIKVRPVTEVPRAPTFVPGIISVRGMVLPIIDLRLRLRLPATAPTKASRILIVSKGADHFGLLVDAVQQVERLTEQEIEPPPPIIGGQESEFLAGIGRASGRMLILLALDSVLTFEVNG